MIFHNTSLEGVYQIELEKISDERGYFARSWCQNEFRALRLDTRLVQCNTSFNKQKGTLRGLHYQLPPYAETKLVRCTRGAIYDVVLDLRPDSATFLKWTAVTLTPEQGNMLYIPKGCAHGFQSLLDDSDVFYQMSEFYAPEYARGVRWNDPLFGIDWPEPVSTISSKDLAYPDSMPALFSSFADLTPEFLPGEGHSSA
jgi:dTDP-4-dehydrorhamnose 3,5-epimerase